MNETSPCLEAPTPEPIAPAPDTPVDLKVGIANGKVVLAFNQPVTNIQFTGKLARRVAELLRQASYKVKHG